MKVLADKYLDEDAIRQTGILSADGVSNLFKRHESSSTPIAEKVQMDAVINHLLGVQIMHKHFIADDIPKRAAGQAKTLGWVA